MSDAVGEAIYALLSDAAEDLGITDVYVMGDVPPDAAMPYLTYHKRDFSSGRVSINHGLLRRRLQVDVLSDDIAAAEGIADGVESLVIGTSVAATETGSPFPGGFERADGAWRINDFPRGLTDGENVYRIVLLFEQRETAIL